MIGLGGTETLFSTSEKQIFCGLSCRSVREGIEAGVANWRDKLSHYHSSESRATPKAELGVLYMCAWEMTQRRRLGMLLVGLSRG